MVFLVAIVHDCCAVHFIYGYRFGIVHCVPIVHGCARILRQDLVGLDRVQVEIVESCFDIQKFSRLIQRTHSSIGFTLGHNHVTCFSRKKKKKTHNTKCVSKMFAPKHTYLQSQKCKSNDCSPTILIDSRTNRKEKKKTFATEPNRKSVI